MRRALLVLAILLFAPRAWAVPSPTKEACIAAFDEAQRLRRAGSLRISREQLVICSQQECPAVVRADCAGVLREVESAQPSIVLKAADPNGNDLTDVTVELGGSKITSTLDGRALAVDPGKLSLVFSRAPFKPVTVEVVIAEGEKGRIVQAQFGGAGARLKPGPPQPEKRSVGGWAVPAGLAAISVAAFTFAGLSRLSLGDDADALRESCGPTCTQADRDDLSDRLVRANVVFGVGITTLAAAVVTWFVLGPKASSTRASLGNTGEPVPRATTARGLPQLMTW
jgi:hypothetical protein